MRRTDKKKKPAAFVLFKHIKADPPTFAGMYIAYVDDGNYEGNFPKPKVKLANFIHEQWQTTERVVAWIGPIPAPSYDELEVDLEIKIDRTKGKYTKMYAIGPLQAIIDTGYSDGPNPNIEDLDSFSNPKHNFLFEMTFQNNYPTPIKKWDGKNKEWRDIKNPQALIEKMKKKSEKKVAKLIQKPDDDDYGIPF